MQTPLDAAISAAAVAEATYTADLNNVASIQSAIASATSPLEAAQAQLAADSVAFAGALSVLGAAAQAAELALAPAPAPLPSAA
jgi:hypothetical protein